MPSSDTSHPPSLSAHHRASSAGRPHLDRVIPVIEQGVLTAPLGAPTPRSRMLGERMCLHLIDRDDLVVLDEIDQAVGKKFDTPMAGRYSRLSSCIARHLAVAV